MADQILFNGLSTATPAVMTAVNDTALAPASSPGGINVVMIGQSAGGKPNYLYSFGSPQAAAAVLVSGELLTAVTKAFAPANAVGSPATVYAMRVGSMTSGSLTLPDTAGNPAIVLTPTQAGTPALASKAQLSVGSVSGYKMTVAITGGTALIGDNLSRSLMTVYYTGSGANPTVTAAQSGIVLTAGGTSITLLPTTFTTVGAMVDAINSQAGWTAIAAPSVTSKPSANVDSFAATAVPAGGLAITANTWAIIDWVNSAAGGSLFAATSGAANSVQPAVSSAFTFATGAANPPVLLSDWVNALVALQSANVQALAVLSPLASVQAAADAHCQYMSSTGRRERRAFSGPALGTSLAAVQGLPIGLNSDRSSLIWPGYYDYDVNGNLTLYAPYMTAAIVAAGFAALSPGQTMTNVALNVQGLEVQINSPTDTDPLILSGVTPVRKDTDGFVVVRAITTWQQNNNFNRVEVSCGYAVDYVCRTIRSYQKALLGSQGKAGSGVSPLTLSRVQAASASALNFCATPAPNGPGAIVGDANSPAWQNLLCSAIGDEIQTVFECSPVIPLNFITNTVSIVPYSGTTGAVSQAQSASTVTAA